MVLSCLQKSSLHVSFRLHFITPWRQCSWAKDTVRSFSENISFLLPGAKPRGRPQKSRFLLTFSQPVVPPLPPSATSSSTPAISLLVIVNNGAPPASLLSPNYAVAVRSLAPANNAAGISARLYLPAGVDPGKKLPVVVFFHGGASMVHTAASPLYHIYSASLAAAAPAVVVSVNYRLAPEHRVPPAYDDAFAALKAVVAACRADGAEAQAEPWLAGHGDASRIVLAGDSAGGNMAHNVAIRMRKEGGIEGHGDMVSGIVLLHPYFWGKEPLGAEPTDPGDRTMFDPTWEFICGGKFDLDHPYINPMASPEEWRQLGSRRVLVTTADQCWFVERARAYAEGIKKCGWEGELEFYETKGEAHVFFLPKHGSDNAAKELAVVAEFVRRC